MLFRFNEQIRLMGKEAKEKDICFAFAKIEQHRENIPLTPFEFHTLAALFLFQKYLLDVWICEVGLGGRWDAVNILDADVSIVASIDMDHMDYLGETREAIGREKAGIFRKEKPAVYGDLNPPSSLIAYAREIGTPLFNLGQSFFYSEDRHSWNWQ